MILLEQKVVLWQVLIKLDILPLTFRDKLVGLKLSSKKVSLLEIKVGGVFIITIGEISG